MIFLGLISSAIGAISSALGSVAGTLGAVAVKTLSVTGQWIGPVSNIVSATAQMYEVLNKEDKVEELGAKAMQPETRKAEEFSSNAEYLDYLRNDVKLDTESFKNAGEVEKVARQGVGMSLAMRGINEKKGFEIPVNAWVSMAKIGFDKTSTKEVNAIIDTFKEEGLKSFAKYVDGKLENINKVENVTNSLVGMYKQLEPQTPIKAIEKKVMNMEVGDIKPKE
jgi:hypothetical protein